MRLVINALATTNLSGWFVISGHLRVWQKTLPDDAEIIVLCHPGNRDLFESIGAPIAVKTCPAATQRWLGRARWERLHLSKTLQDLGANALLSLSGMCPSGLSVPVIPYAMNPWALVSGMAQTLGEKIKAFLQRTAYRSTVKNAAGIAFLSEYMRTAYRRNAGCEEADSEVVYIGIDDDVRVAAIDPNPEEKFAQRQILSVSAMARHKGVETVVRAMARLPDTTSLLLVGGWPDPAYREEIEAVIRELKLETRITISGHLSRSELLAAHRKASVFCLMSHCESFGIPSLEAQALGSPVVTSSVCAMPEVCGAGGRFAPPGDVEKTAAALEPLLTDREKWNRVSQAALENIQRFHWEKEAGVLWDLIERCVARRQTSL